MSESTLEKIIRKTGRKPVHCKCEQCKRQCLRTPCLGTPDDILRLIEAGYADKLAPTEWATGLFLGRVSFTIKMIQIKNTLHGCILFEDGLCKLHDLGLKPTEGRLSHHTIKLENFDFSKSLTWQVAKTWLDEEYKPIIYELYGKYCDAQQIALER